MSLIETLPSNVIAHVGSFLDTYSRCSAHIAHKCFSSIHELLNTYSIDLKSHQLMLNEEYETKLKIIKKLAPMLQNMCITFHNFNSQLDIDYNKLSRFSHIDFKYCSTSFVVSVLKAMPHSCSNITLGFALDKSLNSTEELKELVHIVTEKFYGMRISLHLSNRGIYYTLLCDRRFCRQLYNLSILITKGLDIPVTIKLQHIPDDCLVDLKVYDVSKIREIVDIHKLTSMCLDSHASARTYTALGEALYKNKLPMKLKQLTLHHPLINHAYDSDTSIFQILKHCASTSTELRTYNVSHPCMPSFINSIITLHKYKCVILGVLTYNDIICARAIQLIFPCYDVRIQECPRLSYAIAEVDAITSIKDLYYMMNEETKWWWYWIPIAQ